MCPLRGDRAGREVDLRSRSQWMNAHGETKHLAITTIGTVLGRARCPQPAQVSRMRQSLARHGQLMPAIVVVREGTVELVDGFKRRAAALEMGWPELWVSVRPLDACSQWTAMLTLNRSGSLSVLEEGLIIRELCRSGLPQVEIAALVGRHKSWVSRRLGLVERLHSELVEWVRTGLMSAGVARRLMVLPAGNQLEAAAVASSAKLTTEEAELWVSLWQKTRDPEIRRFLLTAPRQALMNAQPEKVTTPVDPRLSAQGQRLVRALSLLRGVALRLIDALQMPSSEAEWAVLEPQIERTAAVLPKTLEALDSVRRGGPCATNDEPSATPISADC